MALEITGNIELDNGISLSSVYGRTIFNLQDTGNIVKVDLNVWNSEADYTNGKFPFGDTIFRLKRTFNYDRTTDGSDLLDFSNQVIKTELEAQGYSVVITEL